MDLFMSPKSGRPIYVFIDGDFINFRREGSQPNALVQDWEFDRWEIPDELKMFIIKFDSGNTVHPFSFELAADDGLMPYLKK
jgi:hypothetical protein